jgi:hypothetical protein
MRVAFIGCRDWTDDAAVRHEVKRCRRAYGDHLHIITGCASGADASARAIAEHTETLLTVHRADWEAHGKAAGPKRNAMIVAGAEACVAFWDGQSRGTLDCISQFVRAGKPVRIVPRRR